MTPSRTGPAWGAPSRSLPELSAVRLDELLHELLDRVGAVTAMQERLRGLLDAVVGIASDLELSSVLERIVQAACRLVGARYGALGVLGPDRLLSEFITYGLTDEERVAIGELPRGHGVLGLLIDSPEPLRMPAIGEHPQSYGFPPNHPMMRSFLGVPVRLRDRVFGNLYLAEKVGTAEFSKDDEDIVIALAAAAGVAIENARLYELGERRQRWLEAGTEISNALLGDVDRDTALRLVAARAREASTSAVAAVALCEGDEFVRLAVVDLADDLDFDLNLDGLRFRARGTVLGPVLDDGASLLLEDIQTEPGAEILRDAGVTNGPRLGPTLIVPLRSSDGILGALVLLARRDRRVMYTNVDLQVAQSFAAQAGLALARATALVDRELIAVLGDRDRIARDLHDVVIQRLFATGLGLQTAARLSVRPEVRASVDSAVDVIDGVIRDIRGAIFELHNPRRPGDFRTALRDLGEEMSALLGFPATLTIDGPLESLVWEELREDVLAVMRETLSNVARHASATSVDVEVIGTARTVRVTVTDDGRGMGETQRRSGLANLAQRAEKMGGSFDVWSAHPRGTVVEWRVPLSADPTT